MLSHIDPNNQPTMVDISEKSDSQRQAVAQTLIQLPLALKPYLQGEELILKKGPVIQTAIIAGTMAVKKTSDLIPFCHQIPIESCKFVIEIDSTLKVMITCEVKTSYKTGVEMEALCGASVAALTIYDMCKAVSPQITISQTKLLTKTGGKTNFKRVPQPLYGLVLTGGKSKRMQQDKALLKYYDQPHAKHIFDLLSNYCEYVYLSARREQWCNTELASLPTLVDHDDDLGPLGGILTALETHPEACWLIMACDLAYVNAGTIEKLLENYHDEVVATCYQNPEHGFPEPLCALYTPQALKQFQRAKTAKIYCPVKVLQMSNCYFITPGLAQEIANINTPDEYHQVRHEHH
ncbi:cyclic pyranopterin monophosphate synthase MoaC [Synechococcus sp. PCC 6312]|uniref:cyclic pyranopterin monophosphate synthase MoaC n=1 Tax=Synechococcus sp. (strain ATCC 27167 / PCC 6312) TaxID=195253 RepID=UPI00029ED647|nr:cyclic pyranopterin monophosphate synthase MoaC [Synechococcus sp. PCC 6312]AFY60301.1 cyclic pyranopterin monophosphate synthase subunit MoaC [Synechococcus sp. PCC 6312]